MTHSTKDDFDDDDEYHVDSSAYDDVDKDDGGNGRRVRKRDLLRNRITKKLNTDYLFRGMPSIESMLSGGGGGGLSSSSSTTASTGDEEEGHDRGGGGGSGRTIPTTGSSKLQNQYMTGAEKDARLDELLTYEEIRAIDDKYDARKRASGITIPDTLLVMGDENNDNNNNNNDNNNNNNNNNNFIDKEDNNNNETLLISRNEAKRIIDYTIEEEKNMELRNLRLRKKEELVARWEERNANVDNVGTDNGNYDNDYENDGVVYEIVTNDDERYSLENAKRAQINELESYYKEQMMQRQLSVDEEDVNSSSSSSSNSSGDATVDNGKSKDFDTLYEETINTLQTSRYDKLRTRLFIPRRARH